MSEQNQVEQPLKPSKNNKPRRKKFLILLSILILILLIYIDIQFPFFDKLYLILSLPIIAILGNLISLLNSVRPLFNVPSNQSNDQKLSNITLKSKKNNSRIISFLKKILVVPRRIKLVILQLSKPNHRSPKDTPIFLVNMPLNDANEFYGRDYIRKELIDRTLQCASTAIIGPSKIGKTWMISYLKLINHAKFGSNFRFGYLHTSLCQTMNKFIEIALILLGCTDLTEDPANLTLDTLEKAVNRLTSKKQIPILCIDDFDHLDIAIFNETFFKTIRGLNTIGLVLIVTSQKPVLEINANLNFFESLNFDLFSEDEAKNFIQEKSKLAGFTDKEQQFILDCALETGMRDRTHWLPLRLQRAGKILLAEKDKAANNDAYRYNLDDQQYKRYFRRLLR